jgi:beta-lactamase class A
MQDLAFPRVQVVFAVVAVLALVLMGSPPSPRSVTATTMPTWSEREATARWIATHRPDTVAFAALDAAGQQVAAYRADTAVPAASTIKIMIVAAYLRQAAVAQRDLTSRERSQMYNVVSWSSNDDATRLLQQVGWPAMAELAGDAGMGGGFVPDYDAWGLTEVTAASLAQLFHRLPSLLPQRHRDFALGLFQEVVPGHQWGMPAVTPVDWDWYVKGGWISTVVNQVGTFTSGAEEFTVAITVAGGPDTGTRVTLAPDDVPAVQSIEAVMRAFFAGGSIPAGPAAACRPASAVSAGAEPSDAAMVPVCGWAAARPSAT